MKYDYWWASMQSNCAVRLMQLANEAGSAKRLYEMSEEELLHIKGISQRLAGVIVKNRKEFNLDIEYEKLINSGIRFIPWYDSDYPEKLREINGHPFGIFNLGHLPDGSKKSVAIIGARDCSEYGRMIAKRIGNDLASYGVQVISGMAYGIDGICQMAAVDAGGESFGVLGCGVDVCYPASNRALYNKLIESGGLISEYPPGTRAIARLFPPRNRIISALSDIVVVVEAREKSGTMITVDMALEQGKDVAVIPGRITDPLSSGCIKLLKQGAMVITSAEDIMYVLDENFENKKNGHGYNRERVTLGREEYAVYLSLDLYAKSLSKICDETGLQVAVIIKSLIELMTMGLVSEVGKGNFVIAKECDVSAKM